MIAYACVYRRPMPLTGDRKQTEAAAVLKPILCRFLEHYDKGYLDWGDDPSFFSAKEILGDVRRASWGVCRSDVRRDVSVGDFVVFFAGIPVVDGWWKYYWGWAWDCEALGPYTE